MSIQEEVQDIYLQGCKRGEEIERGRIIEKLGMMRQWLNEDRITDPNKLVSVELLAFWLGIEINNHQELLDQHD